MCVCDRTTKNNGRVLIPSIRASVVCAHAIVMVVPNSYWLLYVLLLYDYY